MKLTLIDWYIIAGLVLASFFVRMPFISYPSVPVFDEDVYVMFLASDINKIRYFEIHPPLARMIFSIAYGESDVVPLFHTQNIEDKSFDDFPYIPARKVSVLFGTLIPALVFIIASLFGIGRKFSIIAGVVAVFDSLLIVYSRLILPDSILWFFCLLSVVFAILSARLCSNWRWFFAFLSGLFVGLAFSVKWTGGVFGIIAVVIYLIYIPGFSRNDSGGSGSGSPTRFNHPWWNIIALSLIVFFISISSYFVIWGIYLNRFEGGPVDPERSFYANLADDVIFPSVITPRTVLEYIYSHTKTSVSVQRNSLLIDRIMVYGYPEKWPLGLDVLNVWQKKGERQSIRFAGNFPVYVLTSISIIALMLENLFRIFKRNKDTVVLPKVEAILLFGYMVCYFSIVCMEWTRPMFLYHYVPAYFFATLILAHCLERLVFISPVSGKLAIRAVLILAVVFFFFQSLYTYGF